MIKLRTSLDYVVAVVGIIAILMAVTATVLWVKHASEGVKIDATFDDASPLYPGNAVRASGVQIGTIDSIDLVNGKAVVKMTVDDSVLPLHTDAHALIIQQDLLGERYVTIERGSPRSPVVDSSSVVNIPEDHTSRSVDLQAVLNGVDNPTGTALAAFFTTIGEGMDKNGPQIARGIENLQPSLQSANKLGGILRDQNVLLRHMVDTTQPVLSALATDNGKRLDGLVGAGDQLFGSLADNQGPLRDSLQRLPGTLVSAQAALANVAGVAREGTPTLHTLRPVTRDLKDISRELRRFSNSADPALDALKPVLKKGRDLLDEVRPVVRHLRDSGEDTKDIARNARPLLNEGLADGGLNDLMEFAKNWSLSTTSYDGLSHVFRVFARYSPKVVGEAAVAPIPGAPFEPIKGFPAPDLTPGVAPFAPYPDRQGTARDTDYPRGGRPGGNNNNATGLSSAQEHNMVGQLLGGH
jgi:phospholipid/cholesterol/gamma-HCH transport system substrate-binding protein